MFGHDRPAAAENNSIEQPSQFFQEEVMFDARSKDPTETRSEGGKHITELNGGIMKQLHHLACGRRTRLLALL